MPDHERDYSEFYLLFLEEQKALKKTIREKQDEFLMVTKEYDELICTKSVRLVVKEILKDIRKDQRISQNEKRRKDQIRKENEI